MRISVDGRRRLFGASCAALLFACSSSEPTSIQIPSTEGAIHLDYDAQITGRGSTYVGEISVAGDVGSIVFDGVRMPVIAYTQDWFPAAQRYAYTLLTALPNLWVVFFAYCDTNGQLTDIWYETTNGVPNTDERATGTCTSIARSGAPQVKFPAVNMSFPRLVQGFRVDGANLQYDGTKPGVLRDGVAWQLFPFTTVHCTTCGFGDVYELHSILFDSMTSQACFAILYLGLTPGHVFLNLALCLPNLTKLPFADFPARYTTP